MDFIRDREQQRLYIDDLVFTPEQARIQGSSEAGSVSVAGAVSELQCCMAERYGKESFAYEVACFAAQWFDAGDCVQVQTSGSTGVPKQLWVTKDRMQNSAAITLEYLGLKAGDRALLCLPMQYIAGKMVVVRSLMAGLRLHLQPPSSNPLQDYLDAGGVEPFDFAAMIPMQVFNALHGSTEALSALHAVRKLIIGGGAVDEAMGRALESFESEVYSTYGMTETLSHIALRRLSGAGAATNPWYQPLQGVSLSLSDLQTLTIVAPHVCPERLVTNDIVEFNEQGQFKVLGRKDNVINSGGVKVQIEQVEAALARCVPPNLDFMITSRPDAKFGEVVVLLYHCTKQASESNTQSLLNEAIATLPLYWQPKLCAAIDVLPQTGNGKPDRALSKRLVAAMASEQFWRPRHC